MKKSHCLAFLLGCIVVGLSGAASFAQEGGPQKQPINSPVLAEASRLSLQVVALYNQGKYDEALPFAKRAVEIRQKELGSENQLTGVALRNLASLYFAKKNYIEAVKIYERALKAYEKSLGDNDPKVADVLESYAWSNYGLGDTGRTETCLLRALAIREKAFGPDSKEAGESLFVLGQFYQKLGRADTAVKTYKRAIPTLENTAGPNSKELGTLLEKCACALLAIGEKQEGFGMGIRAQIILHPRGPGSVVGNVLQGRAIFRAEPVYPEAAKHERISGSVIVEVTVDETGKVTEARSICGPDALAGVSVDAAKRWRFTPTLRSGQPIKVIGTITFNYHL
ncbi:MAG TPA: TonB family protein [Blastocatellia bacterium]|nr:TonB family protein [Blastocatellia bacterium]